MFGIENMYWVLENGIVRPALNLEDFAEGMANGERNIGYDIVVEPNGQLAKISTIFLGFNYNWHYAGPPLIFETMIFGGQYDMYQKRYTTLEEAKAGHATVLEQVKYDHNYK